MSYFKNAKYSQIILGETFFHDAILVIFFEIFVILPQMLLVPMK